MAAASPPNTPRSVVAVRAEFQRSAWPFLIQPSTVSVLLSRKSPSEKDSGPTLQGHAAAEMGGLRHKATFAQPINNNRRRIAIPEECEITQKTQIASL